MCQAQTWKTSSLATDFSCGISPHDKFSFVWLIIASAWCFSSRFTRLQLPHFYCQKVSKCFVSGLAVFTFLHRWQPLTRTFSDLRAKDVGAVVFYEHIKCAVCQWHYVTVRKRVGWLEKKLYIGRCDPSPTWSWTFAEIVHSGMFSAECLKAIQSFWPSSPPEVLQKKPGPLYTDSEPFSLVLPALSRPSQTLALTLVYLCVTVF